MEEKSEPEDEDDDEVDQIMTSSPPVARPPKDKEILDLSHLTSSSPSPAATTSRTRKRLPSGETINLTDSSEHDEPLPKKSKNARKGVKEKTKGAKNLKPAKRRVKSRVMISDSESDSGPTTNSGFPIPARPVPRPALSRPSPPSGTVASCEALVSSSMLPLPPPSSPSSNAKYQTAPPSREDLISLSHPPPTSPSASNKQQILGLQPRHDTPVQHESTIHVHTEAQQVSHEAQQHPQRIINDDRHQHREPTGSEPSAPRDGPSPAISRRDLPALPHMYQQLNPTQTQEPSLLPYAHPHPPPHQYMYPPLPPRPDDRQVYYREPHHPSEALVNHQREPPQQQHDTGYQRIHPETPGPLQGQFRYMAPPGHLPGPGYPPPQHPMYYSMPPHPAQYSQATLAPPDYPPSPAQYLMQPDGLHPRTDLRYTQQSGTSGTLSPASSSSGSHVIQPPPRSSPGPSTG